MDYDSCLKSNE